MSAQSLYNVHGEDAMKIAEMSAKELHKLITQIVEQKLEEFLGDPDLAKEIKDDVRERLKRTYRAKRGIPAAEVAKKHGLDW